MNEDYRNGLLAFRRHLTKTLDDLFSQDEVPEYLETIEITINRRTFEIALGADTFDMLKEMVEFELSECEE